MRKLLILGCLFFSPLALSDSLSETNEWYIAKNGQYLIRDSINNGYFAMMGTNTVGDLNVYLQFWDNDGCQKDGNKVLNHDPLLVNGKLVKYSQACNGEWRTFFPSTEAGRKYLISEFKKKNLVEITTYDKNFKVLFSAKGFTKLFNAKKIQAEAI